MQAAVKETLNVTSRNSLESSIGNTPLIGFRTITKGLRPGVEVYAKAEHLNPSGSVKDRAAFAMILDGENSGGQGTSKSSTLKTKIGAEAGGSSTEVLCPAG